MCAGGVHLVGASIGDMSPDLDEGRAARLRLRVMNGVADGGGIVAVGQCLDMPTQCLESLAHVFGQGVIGVAFYRNMVVVVDEDEVAEREVAGDRSGFGAD